jgi:hypothetical protein
MLMDAKPGLKRRPTSLPMIWPMDALQLRR